jgi:hypothetical protein
MAAAIARGGSDERAKVVVELLLIAGPLLFPVALVGGWWVLRNAAAKAWRALGWAAVAILALVLVSGGRATTSPASCRSSSRPARSPSTATVFAATATLSGIVAATLVLPIVPVSSLGATPIPELYKESAEQGGWPELATAAEGSVATLAPADRARAVILTANYGEAAGLQLLRHDLPPVYSATTPTGTGARRPTIGPSSSWSAGATFGRCVLRRMQDALVVRQRDRPFEPGAGSPDPGLRRAPATVVEGLARPPPPQLIREDPRGGKRTARLP